MGVGSWLKRGKGEPLVEEVLYARAGWVLIESLAAALRHTDLTTTTASQARGH
jgi:hypothetical protein